MVQRQLEALQMLEFAKSLDIDPIREPEMLWIAEEAANASLPLGWQQHEDQHGRTYFYNVASGESVWYHPWFGVYRKSVEYYRAVQHVGGFWTVDEDIAKQEEQVRLKLADWMELFDDKGQKYFFNKRTESSRFDDPRTEMYQALYEIIRMVAKMKEQLKFFARAQKPHETTTYEKLMQQSKEDEEKLFHSRLVRIQCFARLIVARRNLRRARLLRDLGRGPQPMRGKLRLRLESGPDGQKEVVLGETTPHRRNKMAARIQARVRGIQGRRIKKQLMVQREHNAQKLVKVQRLARRFLLRKRMERAVKQRILDAVRFIQRVRRGMVARKRARQLRKLRDDRLYMIRCVVKMQCLFRQVAAKIELRRRKRIKYARSVIQIQSVYKVLKARRHLGSLLHLEEPIQCAFACNELAATKAVIPWAIRVLMVPTDAVSGNVLEHPYGRVNLFVNVGPDNALGVAATSIQKIARGMLSRLRFKRDFEAMRVIVVQIMEGAAKQCARRKDAATTIQKIFRGWFVRHNDILGKRKMDWIELRLSRIESLQASMRKFVAQDSFGGMVRAMKRKWGSTCIQRHWRGWLARRSVEILAMEAVWPLKGFFDYTATGPNSAYIGVRFFNNPRFDGYKYFMDFGGQEELNRSLEEMAMEVELCVEDYLESVEQPLSEDEQQDVNENDETVEGAEPPTDAPETDAIDSGTPAETAAETIPDWMRVVAERNAEPVAEPESHDPATKSAKSSRQGTKGEALPTIPEQASPPHESDTVDASGKAGAEASDLSKAGTDTLVGSLAGSAQKPNVASEVDAATAADAKDATRSAAQQSEIADIASSHGKLNESFVEEPSESTKAGLSTEVDKSISMDETDAALLSTQADPFDETTRRPSFIERQSIEKEARRKALEDSLSHLSEEDKYAKLSDLEASRQFKVEELVRRQRKHQSRHSRHQRREAAALRGNELAMPSERKRAYDAMLKQKGKEENIRREAWRTVAMKERFQHEMADKHEQQQADKRDRRLRIAEKRKEQIESYSPIEAPMQVETQLMMHRHIHHHVHYHNPGSTDNLKTLPITTSSEVAGSGGRLGDKHRQSASDLSGGTIVKRHSFPVARAMSAGQLPPLSQSQRPVVSK